MYLYILYVILSDFKSFRHLFKPTLFILFNLITNFTCMKKLTLILSMLIVLVGFNANAAMYIVGSGPFNNWQPGNGVEMTDNGDGTYTYTTAISGSVLFVFGDGLDSNWNNFNTNHRYGPATGDTDIDANVWIPTSKAGDHGAYKFIGDGSDYVFIFDENNLQFRVEGYIPPVVYSSLTVVGSSTALFGTTWDPENADNDMTLDNGLYTWEKKNVELTAGSFEFKVVADHDVNYASAWPSSNYHQAVEKHGYYDVTITFDPDTKTVNCVATMLQEIIDEDDPIYTVAGTPAALFGTEWTPSDVNNEMTKGQNGIYTWTKNGVELTACTVEFKVVLGHDWGVEYPSSNYVATIAENGNYDVTITFDPETKEITFDATAVEVTDDFYTVAGAPAAIFGEEWNAANAANNMTLTEGVYTWSKEDVELTANDFIEFKVVKNANWNTSYPANNYEYTCPADGTYDLLITFNPETEEVTFTANKQGDEPVVISVYTVVGPEAIFGTNWDETDTNNDMVLDAETGLYTWTADSVALTESFGFKVVGNHSWANEWPQGFDNNWIVNIAEAGDYSLVITFNAENGEINCVATKLGGEEPPVEMVYTVVGPESIFGSNWNVNDEANNMVKGEDGNYTWTKEEVTLYGNFEFKVVGNHDYSIYEWPMGPDNWVANVAEAGIYTIEIIFNPEADDADRIICNLTKTGDVTPVEHVYTVAGTENLFGSDWDPTDEANNMVKGEDGIYTWTKEGVEFTEYATIEFKVVQDHAWDYAWPSSNWWAEITEPGKYNFVITFNPSADDMNKITFTVTPYVEPDYTRGDVNMDDAINIADVTSLINYLLTNDATGLSLEAANCNLDNIINIADVTELINFLLTNRWSN